jgi:hypothetical protein
MPSQDFAWRTAWRPSPLTSKRVDNRGDYINSPEENQLHSWMLSRRGRRSYSALPNREHQGRWRPSRVDMPGMLCPAPDKHGGMKMLIWRADSVCALGDRIDQNIGQPASGLGVTLLQGRVLPKRRKCRGGSKPVHPDKPPSPEIGRAPASLTGHKYLVGVSKYTCVMNGEVVKGVIAVLWNPTSARAASDWIPLTLTTESCDQASGRFTLHF